MPPRSRSRKVARRSQPQSRSRSRSSVRARRVRARRSKPRKSRSHSRSRSRRSRRKPVVNLEVVKEFGKTVQIVYKRKRYTVYRGPTGRRVFHVNGRTLLVPRDVPVLYDLK